MKRFRNAALILIVVLVSLAMIAEPAAAQIWARVGYWPANATVNNPASAGGGVRGTWNSGLISLNLSRALNPDWAISFNGDFGGQSNWTGSWATATSGSDSFWNVNLHRVFTAPAGRFSLFGGYESAGLGSVFPASVNQQTLRVSGFRLGADFMHQMGPWGVAAWAATGLAMNSTWAWPGTAAPGPENSSGGYYEYGAVVTFMAGSWTLDGGYRGLNVSSGGTANYCGCTVSWTGFTFGISRMFP